MGALNSLNKDWSDLLFRMLFCSIFVGLGSEHLFSDGLIRLLMPAWVPYPRAASILCGLWLVGWGALIFVGWKIRLAAEALALFLLIVTIGVHLPGVFGRPPEVDLSCQPYWDILQRSNLVKNVCLLGVCFHLIYHQVGRFSLEAYFERRDFKKTGK